MLLYDTDLGNKKMSITAGVPQGSILGPTLWNVLYNGVVTLGLPPGAEVIGFADDIALTVFGESIEEIELLTSDAVSRFESWMQLMRLEIAHKKTEFLITSSHKTVQSGSIQIGDERIESIRHLKYLGVIIDDRLRFRKHSTPVTTSLRQQTR